jgi:SAM-dependent methyltransferase
MTQEASNLLEMGLDIHALRCAIQEEYEEVAREPQKGFHFHTGRPLAQMLGYKEFWLEGISESAIESFAGTGNPFSLGELQSGHRVVDIGCGAGIDSFIAAKMVGPEGKVIGIDMTAAMLDKARQAAKESGVSNIKFYQAFAEELPIPDSWADVIISNGVLNLMPNKSAALKEMRRILKIGGRLQISDILVQKEVSLEAKQKIELWTG